MYSFSSYIYGKNPNMAIMLRSTANCKKKFYILKNNFTFYNFLHACTRFINSVFKKINRNSLPKFSVRVICKGGGVTTWNRSGE